MAIPVMQAYWLSMSNDTYSGLVLSPDNECHYAVKHDVTDSSI